MIEPAHPPLGTGLHVAIIMDGSGRWAERRGLARIEGHRVGAASVRSIVEAAVIERIGILTLFAFSSDNWTRPADEVAGLFDLLGEYLAGDLQRCRDRGVRLSVIGRRDRLPSALCAAIAEAEGSTAAGNGLWLRLAVDYSSRDAILRAANAGDRDPSATQLSRESFGWLVAAPGTPQGRRPAAADVDLLLRTGGERRLSDFLLWEAAYAELLFTDLMWPEFGPDDLRTALREYHGRDRRFGRVRSVPPAPWPVRRPPARSSFGA